MIETMEVAVLHIYRGILHNHSSYSREGCYPLSILRKRWAEYLDFAAMTEHAERTTPEAFAEHVQECDALSDEHFRFIPGLEVATESGDMLLLGCRKYIRTTDPFEVLREAPDCLILLAHPEEERIIPAVFERVHGIEWWNTRRMGAFVPPLDWMTQWGQELPTGKIVTGGNDIHTSDPKRKVFTLVQSSSNSETALLAAIKQGRFVTSNGLFTLTPDGNCSYMGREITSPFIRNSLAASHRFLWRLSQRSLRRSGKLLRRVGLEQQRASLSRLVRQHM